MAGRRAVVASISLMAWRVDSTDPAPSENGQCALGNYEYTYTVNGEPAGRILCTTYVSGRTGETFRVIEWTNDELYAVLRREWLDPRHGAGPRIRDRGE